MENLNNKINKSDVMGIYTALYPTIRECIHGNLLELTTFYMIKQLLKRVKELLLSK